MTLEQRLLDLAIAVRTEYNKLRTGDKTVHLAERLDDGATGQTYAAIASQITTQINDAVNALLDGVPAGGDTLNKLWLEIQALTGGGYATLTDVNNAIQAVVGAAPAALDTLQELAAALNDDANAVATLIAQIATKADAADVYTKTEADALFKTQAEFDAEIGNPDVDLVAEFESGLL